VVEEELEVAATAEEATGAGGEEAGGDC